MNQHLQLPFNNSLVVIPTYNEADNVVNIVHAIQKISPELDILIVDDNSPDGTSNLVVEEQKQNDKLFLIQRSGKSGLGSAYILGFKWALNRNYQYIFEMDCDFSHDPNDLEPLLDRACSGQDLVVGSRYVGGVRIVNWPIRRLLLSYLAALYTRIWTGMAVKDPTSGFNCISTRVFQSIDLDSIFSNGYSFQIELKYRVWSQGMKIDEVPIIFYERREGHSKMNSSIVWEAIFAVIKLRFKKLIGTL